MIGKQPTEYQMSIFEVALESFIDMNHGLVLLSKRIDWSAVESDFAEYYCAEGRPSECSYPHDGRDDALEEHP